MNRWIPPRLALALRASMVAAALVIATACGFTGNAARPVDVKLLEPAPNQELLIGVTEHWEVFLGAGLLALVLSGSGGVLRLLGPSRAGHAR